MPSIKGGVDVSVSVDGDAVPGAALAATATVHIGNGSTLQGIEWTVETEVPGVALGGADTANATVTLPARSVYKDHLITLLSEPPIGEDQLPPNVPLPEGEFPGGLQDRFHVVGVNPFALEETGPVSLHLTVTTTSGTYTEEVDLHTELPFKTASGLLNVPIGIPVILHGKDGVTPPYDWALATKPGGSSAALADATSQNPDFTPDVAGKYNVTVTDTTLDPAEVVTIEIHAGTWSGGITSQDGNGRPNAGACTGCHNGSFAPDKFTEWKETGHAEIFTNNLNTSTHYGSSCFPCHSVGYDPDVDNGGMDDAPDYDAFLAAGSAQQSGRQLDHRACQLSEHGEARQHPVRELPRSAEQHGPRGQRTEDEYLIQRLRRVPRRAAPPCSLPAVAAEPACELRAGRRRKSEWYLFTLPHGERLPGVDGSG